MEEIKTSKTRCSYCEKLIDDSGKKVGEFISHCGRFSIVGNFANYKNIEGGKMEEPKEEKKTTFGKTYFIRCNGCKQDKYTREEVYKARVQKAGSEEKMLANYLCRDCRPKKTVKKIEQAIPA